MTSLAIRAAIAAHSTAVDDGPWDGATAERRLPESEASLRQAHAWVDPSGDPDTKSAYKFIHHDVDGDGDVGAANLVACSSGIGILNGGRGGTTIPAGDRRGVYDHLARHLRDGDREPPGLRDWVPYAEERVVDLDEVEVRDADPQAGKPPRIVGHAALFDVWSDDLGGFRERIRPGAFTKTLKEADVRATFNHDPNYVLGRTRAETLVLREERKGLHSEVFPPDTAWARDLMTSMARGDITQMSFKFGTIIDRWSEKPNRDGLLERNLEEVRLYDVAVVTFPAYPATDAAVRSVVERAGIDWATLNDVIDKAYRGIFPSDLEASILDDTITTLKAYLPAAPSPVAHAAATLAGRSIAHARRQLELAERDL